MIFEPIQRFLGSAFPIGRTIGCDFDKRSSHFLNLDFKSLDKEIKEMESDLLKRATDLEDVAKQKGLGESTSYIG